MTDWEKIFAILKTDSKKKVDTGFMPGIYKGLLKIDQKIQQTPWKNTQKVWRDNSQETKLK